MFGYLWFSFVRVVHFEMQTDGDAITTEEFQAALSAEAVDFGALLDDFIEVQPSLILDVDNESLYKLYELSTHEKMRDRMQFVNILANIWTKQYTDAIPTSTSSMGNLKLLQLGSMYTSLRSNREKIALVSLTLSFMDHELSFFFSPDEIFDYSSPNDKGLIEALEKHVQAMTEPQQIRYLDFATEEVKMNLHSCCYQLAHNSVFVPDESTNITVLVAGEAGAGKSTLINECFRRDLPAEKRCVEGVGENSITSAIEGKTVTYTRPVSQQEVENGFTDGTMLDVGVTLMDCPGLTRDNMNDTTKMCELASAILQRISDGINGKKSPIDVVLWVLPGATSRLPTMDELFIRQLGTLVPVCLVWTRALQVQHIQEFKAWLKNPKEVPVELPICEMFEVYARREKIRDGYQESFGMAELGVGLAKVFNVESHEMREKYIHKLKDWTEADYLERRTNAYRIVKYSAAAAAVIGASPVPYIDTVAVFMLQSTMILKINALYGASLPRNLLSSLITTIITGSSSLTIVGGLSLAGAFLADFIGDTLKLLPGLNLLGMTLSAGTAAGMTAAVGYAFIGGVESLVREYPYLLDVPTDTIEKALLAEAEKTAQFSLNETRKTVNELASTETTEVK